MNIHHLTASVVRLCGKILLWVFTNKVVVEFGRFMCETSLQMNKSGAALSDR